MAINRLSWSSAATALCLCLILPSPAQATSCHSTCRPSLNASLPVNPLCFSDCSGCISIASNQCTSHFIPVWSTYPTGSGKARDYQSFYCLQACPLPWWAWILISVGGLLLLASVGFACYSCFQQQRWNREAATDDFLEMEHGQNPSSQQQFASQAYASRSVSSMQMKV